MLEGMSRDDRLINRAIGIAMTSKCRWRHGALLAKGSRIIAWSPNILRNPSEIDYQGATWHAEIAALRELDRLTGATYGFGKASGLTVYIARVNKAGEPRMSRPCVGCSDILAYRGITTRIWTNELGGLSVEQLA